MPELLAGLVPAEVGAIAQVVRGGRTVLHEAVGARPTDTFRIASVTKSYVAAALLLLIEQGRLSLSDPVSERADPELVDLLRAGGHDPDAITLEHLATHTGGLDDHAGAAYGEIIQADPARTWTRVDQLSLLATAHHPVGPVGGQVHYSDTGYVLLGDVLERATGLDLDGTLRTLLRFDELGLDDTWIESDERRAGAPQMHLGIAVADIHPSMDLWGGGGLVSTTQDLCTWFSLFITGAFLSPESMQKVLQNRDLPGNERQMGLGSFAVARPGWRGHTGYWNVTVTVDPATGDSAAVVVLDRPPAGPLSMDVAGALLDATA